MSQRVWTWKGQRPQTGWRSIFASRVPWLSIDWHVLFLAALLVGTGLLMVHTMELADELAERDGVGRFHSHVKKLVVAVPFLFLGLFVRPRWVRRNAWLFYGVTMVLLCLVPLIGEERNHARRWIQLPLGFDIQPSELAKLGLIVALARALYRNRLESWVDWIAPALLALAPMALVAMQPDLGTALTIVPVTLGMAWVAGARPRHMGAIVLGGALLAVTAFQLGWIQEYQEKRINAWIEGYDPDALRAQRNGPGFHPFHARVCIGNGGWTGTGLGRGVGNVAGHLPERDCDSIFAVIAEEGGLLGAGALVLGYLLLSGFLLVAAGGVRERFGRLVVGGVGLYFAAHFFINVGVNLGLLPMTGLTLPLVSTGGSSLLASFLALGLAVGLSARQEPSLDRDAFRA